MVSATFRNCRRSSTKHDSSSATVPPDCRTFHARKLVRAVGDVATRDDQAVLPDMMADRAEMGTITLSRIQGRGADLWFAATMNLAAVPDFPGKRSSILYFSHFSSKEGVPPYLITSRTPRPWPRLFPQWEEGQAGLLADWLQTGILQGVPEPPWVRRKTCQRERAGDGFPDHAVRHSSEHRTDGTSLPIPPSKAQTSALWSQPAGRCHFRETSAGH